MPTSLLKEVPQMFSVSREHPPLTAPEKLYLLLNSTKGVKIDEWNLISQSVSPLSRWKKWGRKSVANGYSERELPVRQPELNEELEFRRVELLPVGKRKLWPVKDFGEGNCFEDQHSME
ncbi:hypothetical protein CEXT_533001 [Caerostris extrusa]|uniref:Uncharacterized protein n=1 Tax=Caerostris extrusa TaxID=172846 RepID=A0AAV4PPH3_CAEEX|nr:hypothetical protein CEXT_533001 [Caerostris extrusa]